MPTHMIIEAVRFTDGIPDVSMLVPSLSHGRKSSKRSGVKIYASVMSTVLPFLDSI